ncbi:restriction endonuclease subunit R [Campylobacter sp. MIT 12-8780]|uniref:type I restriction endonuclease subunit R n=1 Tax=unclassified Campylobacter TaxID=2593542 RepID=UPI00115EF565|nr:MULTISPECIES: DEAD/DEAH box helicase family protein [unclassified Campylobacter]NDJ27620.1 DEAD/DEAH box helicase family protein [Campylobacter sp. MIT 19-121]TQR40789.1 restriction endonuclease subunit R [Campylobacter sp. MIT 12-8780]
MPEKSARVLIDELLSKAGYVLCKFEDFQNSSLHLTANVAVMEFIFDDDKRADYVLFVDSKPAAIIEAKKQGLALSGAESQSKGYADKYGIFLCYESNANEIYFTNYKEPNARARRLFAFHNPKELKELINEQTSLRARLHDILPLERLNLRQCQFEAINSLENSLKAGKQRALIQMATGAGKTFTACNFTYRLFKYAHAKRILFLVDRNNLGSQAKAAFDDFNPPNSKYKFSQIYEVNHLTTNTIADDSKVVITTIQRLYSMLQGELEFNEELENSYQSDKKTKEVVYNPNLGIGFFDFIIIDECHRSIYGEWRQVLEYFDAFLIGLSATPSKHTIAFFDQNLVSSYTLEESIIDKVNVDYEILRIKTQISENGNIIKKDCEFEVPVMNKNTRKIEYEELDEDLEYDKKDLDSRILAPDQIRTILQAYKDSIFTKLYPQREANFDLIPKTLIFAKDDNHAENITRIAREVFNKGNDFVKKITYSVSGVNAGDLINEFRHSQSFRIAVSVDMIATGTDIKPLEVLIFMRDIKSSAYYEQMLGRGARSISDEDLQEVTPNADSKTHFYVVDAIGVTESEKHHTRVLEQKHYMSFKELLNELKQPNPAKEILTSLASRLIRITNKLDETDMEILQSFIPEPSFDINSNDEVENKNDDKQALTAPQSLNTIASELLNLADEFEIEDKPNNEPLNEKNSAQKESSNKEILKLFHNEKFTNKLLEFAQKSKLYIDIAGKDELIEADFSKEKSQNLINDFTQFILQNKDEITALQIIYSQNYAKRHLTYELINELSKKLRAENFDINKLWNAYTMLETKKVAKCKNPAKNLTNIIQLVRFALGQDKILQDFSNLANSRYNLWLGRCIKKGIDFNKEQLEFLELIKDYIAMNGCVIIQDIQAICEDMGGIYRARAIFKEDLDIILEELNLALVG